MAHLKDRLLTFLLSSEDVKLLNPDWEDQMIEDYLNIFRNLAEIADSVDDQVDFGGGLESLIFDNAAIVAKVRSRLNKIAMKPETVINDGKNRTRLNKHSSRMDDMEQLIHAW